MQKFEVTCTAGLQRLKNWLKKKNVKICVCALGWTLFQKMFGGRNSMSRSTFESHNDKAKQ